MCCEALTSLQSFKLAVAFLVDLCPLLRLVPFLAYGHRIILKDAVSGAFSSHNVPQLKLPFGVYSAHNLKCP